MDVLERILGKKIIAIIRGFKLDETLKTADAVAAGGLGLLEVPFDQRWPLAYTTDKIKALADRYQDGQVLVGAGTVLTVGQVRAAKGSRRGIYHHPHIPGGRDKRDKGPGDDGHAGSHDTQ